jgi:hypothetical protein
MNRVVLHLSKSTDTGWLPTERMFAKESLLERGSRNQLIMSQGFQV